MEQLILRKIVKIIDIRCHILRLKCTQIDFDRPRGASLTELPQTL